MEKLELEVVEQKAQFDIKDILAISMTLVVTTIGIAYGLEVLGDIRDDMTTDTPERNATMDGITAIAKIPAKLPMIVTVILAAIIIGILVRYLWVRNT